MGRTLKATLHSYMTQADMPLCLTLLEGALAMSWQEAALPQKLLEEIAARYGAAQTEAAIGGLRTLGVFAQDAHALSPDSRGAVSALLEELLESMELDAQGLSAGEFVARFLSYVQEANPEIEQLPDSAFGGRVLRWDDKKTCVRLAFSPLCMPAAADYFSQAECHLLAIGPFAAQDWESLYPYFDFPEYRDWVALFDPWSCRKLNISKGNLSGFMDWFFRDAFQKRFYVPETFPDAIHSLGLLRFDDEF